MDLLDGWTGRSKKRSALSEATSCNARKKRKLSNQGALDLEHEKNDDNVREEGLGETISVELSDAADETKEQQEGCQGSQGATNVI